MPFDIAIPPAAGIRLCPVPGLPALFGKRMRDEAAPLRVVEPATEAEALCRALIGDGASVVMTIAPDGLPSLAYRFMTLPPSPSASAIAATIRARFLSELRFRKDLFGYLLFEGAVFQRYAERRPQPVLEGF